MIALRWFVGTLVALVAGFTTLRFLRFLDWVWERSRLARAIIRLAIAVMVLVAGWFFGRAIFGGHQ